MGFDYKIKYSDRKTIAIHILRDGTLEVRCNHNVDKKSIDDFVAAHERWINKHLDSIINHEEKAIEIGSTILLLGKEYPLEKSQIDRTYFDGNAFMIDPNFTNADILSYLKKFYVSEAKKIIKQRVQFHSEIMQLYPTRVNITSATTRWGSCSGKNSLSFPWKLVSNNNISIF